MIYAAPKFQLSTMFLTDLQSNKFPGLTEYLIYETYRMSIIEGLRWFKVSNARMRMTRQWLSMTTVIDLCQRLL